MVLDKAKTGLIFIHTLLFDVEYSKKLLMEVMDIAKAVELLENGEHIALILPTDPSFDLLASAEVLFSLFEKRGKNTGLLYSPRANQESYKEIFPRIFSGKEPLKEFIISLDTTTSPVSQMRYENNEKKIEIIFSPKNTRINHAAVSFREGNIRADCAITLGIKDIEELKDTDPLFLSEVPIVNIDTSMSNKQYGEANLVDTEKSTSTEIIYQFISQTFPEAWDEKSATLCLGALLSVTDNFQTTTLTPDTLLMASELLRLGGNLKSAQEFLLTPKNIGLTQLVGRAVVRSRLDEKNGVLWSFVTAEDFEKTARKSEDIHYVMGRVEREFPSSVISTLLWQDPEDNSIRALLSGRKDILELAEGRGLGSFQSPHLLLSATFQTFKEAEEIIASLLESIL